MAEFLINITDDPAIPLTYDSHVAVYSLENCQPASETKYGIKLNNANSHVYGMFDNYIGEAWKYLYITNISFSQANPCDCFGIEYNSTAIQNIDLPLQIDISSLVSTDFIPLLEIVIDNYTGQSVGVGAININFYIEDIHGTIGETELSSFQILFKACTTSPVLTPVINSPLTYTAETGDPNSYFFQYHITSSTPVTSYTTSGLPLGASFNSVTGFIEIDLFDLANKFTTVTEQFSISAINSGATPTTDTETVTITIEPTIGEII